MPHRLGSGYLGCSGNRNVSFFPIVLNPKKRVLLIRSHPFSFALSLTKHLKCCFLFVLFSRKETISFVLVTALLDSLTHLTSIYGVFTVYKML